MINSDLSVPSKCPLCFDDLVVWCRFDAEVRYKFYTSRCDNCFLFWDSRKK